MLGYVMLG